jgi:hypothetical protein
MWWRGAGVVAGAVLALALRWGGAGAAMAETAAAGDSDAHFLLFSGADLWRYGGFAHGGVLWSPDGLGQEGFTLKLLLAGGAYRYLSGSSTIQGQHGLAAVLPGWRFKQDRSEAVLHLGIDAQDHRLRPDDPSNPLRGVHVGMRGSVDLWLQPTDELMISGAFSVSTIAATFWGRVQFGSWLPGLAWIGPEFHTLGDTKYQQFRAGLHVTGLRTDTLEWSVGAGYVRDTDSRTGAYGRIGLNLRR